MMDDRDRISATEESRNLVGRKDISDYTGWGIPAVIAAVVVIAGVLIFTATNPDRIRTAEYHNLNAKPASSQQAPAGDARGRAGKVPDTNMPTAPRSP
jgi:hypothetical protein